MTAPDQAFRERVDATFLDCLGERKREAGVLPQPPSEIFLSEDGAGGLEDLLTEVARCLDMELVLVGHVNETMYTTVAYHARGGKAAIRRDDTIPIGETYCREEITADRPFVLGDAELEPRFREHPGYVKYGLRAYVGAPLVLTDGTLFGTLCGVDSQPKTVSLAAVECLVQNAQRLAERISERLGLPPAPAPMRYHWAPPPHVGGQD